MQTVQYDYLHNDVAKIRNEVFVEEQRFKDEFDEIDGHCTYLVIYDEQSPIATCRFYRYDAERFAIGRIAVVRAYRGQGIGKMIVERAEQQIRSIGCDRVTLSAQVRAASFYEKLGYSPEGEIFYEETCAHIRMNKQLN